VTVWVSTLVAEHTSGGGRASPDMVQIGRNRMRSWVYIVSQPLGGKGAVEHTAAAVGVVKNDHAGGGPDVGRGCSKKMEMVP